MKNVFVFIVGVLLGAIVVYLLCCRATNTEEVFSDPKGLITSEEAKALDRAFDTRHKLISDSIVKRPDNRSSWYSLVDVRSYLNIAEKQAGELGYKMDGIRVYLGAHKNDSNSIGYTTMFFVPTGNLISNKTSEGSMNFLNFNMQEVGGDIPGGTGLNKGGTGYPPSANYPQ